MEIPGRVSAEIDSVGLAVAGEAMTRPHCPSPRISAKRPRSPRHAPVAGSDAADAFEGAHERGFGFIDHAGGDARNALVSEAQPLPRQLDPPVREIVDWWAAEQRLEAA